MGAAIRDGRSNSIASAAENIVFRVPVSPAAATAFGIRRSGQSASRSTAWCYSINTRRRRVRRYERDPVVRSPQRASVAVESVSLPHRTHVVDMASRGKASLIGVLLDGFRFTARLTRTARALRPR